MTEDYSQNVGGVDVSSPIWLAPLAGITTATFRAFHRRLGAGLTHTEMVSAVGLTYRNKKTKKMLGSPDEQEPTVLQLFAPDVASLNDGARVALEWRGFKVIEINMACPMPKVTKKGSGASLLASPAVAAEMVGSLKTCGLPVWAKIRIIGGHGDDATHRFCDALFEAGADFLMIHGRTPAQRYEGTADKDAVCRLAGLYPGRVGASGDYYAPSDALYYLERGCVSVLAARGVLKDVFLIPKTLDALGRSVPDKYKTPSLADQVEALIEFGQMGIADEGESFTLVLVKRMLGGLFKGFPGAAAVRSRCALCRDWSSLLSELRGTRDLFGEGIPFPDMIK